MDSEDFIEDVKDLQDEVLLRKVLECRRQVNELKRYPGKEIAAACANLEQTVKRMEKEARRRSLSLRARS